MKVCGFIIKRPFSETQLTIFDTYLQEVVTSQLYVVFTVLPVLRKLICCPREFYYLILLVGVSFKKTINAVYHGSQL
jgi:hypothetical protein